MISRNWRQIVLVWSFAALVAVGQSPDPNCPNCNKNRVFPEAVFPNAPQATMPTSLPTHGGFAGPILPGVNDGPALELPPPTGIPVAAIAAQEVDESPVPVIKVKLKAPTCAVVGKEMEYRFRVENFSPTDAHNVIVRTSLPASVRVIRTSPMVHAKEPDLQWNLGTLAGFGVHDLSVVVIPIGLADVKSCTRVQFEYGQCATTKVIATAPEGSEDGRGGMFPGGPYGPGGVGPGGQGSGAGGMGTREPGLVDPNRILDVQVFGPETAAVNDVRKYLVKILNRGDTTLREVGVNLNLDKGMEVVKTSDNVLNLQPGLIGWPNPLIKELPPGASRTLELEIRGTIEGVLCLSAKVSGSPPARDAEARICTRFVRMGGGAAGPGVGLTMEMFDFEDPILRDGKTSFPIQVRNQGQTTATNVRIKAKVPELLAVENVFAPVKYKAGLDDRKDYWVEFEPLATLAGGETQTFNIAVRARGKEGDARFHVEMTADQFDRGPNQEPRWIVEQESTTIVPDEESRIRVREISRKNREKLRIVIP